MADDVKEKPTKKFDFADNQITVADTAMLLGCDVVDVTALIRMGHLKAEGKKPYKVDIKSVIAYKRMMLGADDDADDDE